MCSRSQTKLDILRKAPEIDEDAIKVAEEALEYAIELQDITSEGKSKGGSCGGDNNHLCSCCISEGRDAAQASVIDEDVVI